MDVNFVLFDTALELVPEEIRAHPAVLADSKKRGIAPEGIVLDRSIHHFAMRSLENSERRGRPDIVHMTLLNVTDSPAYRMGYVKIFVHTCAGKFLRFRKGVRPPVNYNNFINLMSQLLRSGRVPVDKEPLIEAVDSSLKNFLSTTEGFSVLLTSRGKRVDFRDVIEKVGRRDITVLVGGYPKGPPPGKLFELCDEAVSIYDGVLASWTVASRIIYDLEKFSLKI